MLYSITSLAKQLFMPHYHIRKALVRDEDALLQIERLCFEFPWGRQDFIRMTKILGCYTIVAEHGNAVVGFMVFDLHVRHVHLLNFAVDPPYQIKGVGRKLLMELLNRLDEKRAKVITELNETNLRGLGFFYHFGFRATRLLRNFYEAMGCVDDAIEMEYVRQTVAPPNCTASVTTNTAGSDGAKIAANPDEGRELDGPCCGK